MLLDLSLIETYQGVRVDLNNRRSGVILQVLLFDCTAILHNLHLLSETVRRDIAALCSAGLRDKHHTRFRMECLENVTSDLNLSGGQ